ncbi:hypothetical protein HPB48_004350 [Haemaphysalis longicornis]|uniref:DM domain-containing protein n=1 Tax=Haemaphysalis longicornis TaxID=44386 RepID=A0A9J6G1C7_HAELO|nr:hypothetical protein HPB48_004350 [Haemaphysalis longicornis]
MEHRTLVGDPGNVPSERPGTSPTSTATSASTTSSNTTASATTRIPKCARCLNHNREAAARDHKRYCPYRICTCPKCRQTVQRQEFMAQVLLRRRCQWEEDQASA